MRSRLFQLDSSTQLRFPTKVEKATKLKDNCKDKQSKQTATFSFPLINIQPTTSKHGVGVGFGVGGAASFVVLALAVWMDTERSRWLSHDVVVLEGWIP